jgi:hypothetical protein
MANTTNTSPHAAGARLIAGMTPEAIRAAQSRFAARVQSGDLGHGISGTRTIRIMGAAGDAQMIVPVLDVSGLAESDLDARVMIELAEQLIQQAATERRQVVAAHHGVSEAVPVHTFDPLATEDILIMPHVIGG